MGRRQIPKQIPARGIMISSSGKGDGLDWLCAVSFSLPKKVFLFFLFWFPYSCGSRCKSYACTRDNTSAFCPGRKWRNKISEKRTLLFIFFIDNWEKWKIILNFHCHTYLQFDLFMITCYLPPSSPSISSNCTPCRGRAYKWGGAEYRRNINNRAI